MTAATEMHMRGHSQGPRDMPWPCSSLWACGSTLSHHAPRQIFREKKNSVAPRKSCGGPVALDVQASMQLGPGWLAELSAVDAC